MSWLTKVLGKDAASILAIDNKHFAARISQRPAHVGAGGAYALTVFSGIMAAGLAADAEIFQMRWTHATWQMHLRSIKFGMWRASATAFAAGPIRVYGTVARSWSADGGAGVAIVMSTANTNKKRTDFPLSKFSDTGIRKADTAAVTAGTKTFDTNPFCGLGSFTSAVAPTATVGEPEGALIVPQYMWQRDSPDEYPFLFETNEGFALRAVVPATGTWGYTVQVEWAEVDPAEVDGWT